MNRLTFFNARGWALAVACVMALGLSGAAQASSDKSSAKEEEKEINKSVEMSAIVFPVIIEGRLENYLFANARIVVADGKNTWKYREKAHFVRDAILRATHKVSVHLDSDPSRLDLAKAEKVCLEAANEAVGEEAFVSMNFLQVASQNMY